MTLDTFVPTAEETEIAKEFGRKFRGSSITFATENKTESIEVPDQVLKIIRRVIGILAEGRAFTLIPQEQELTTQQAADILNVSRPYLNKLIDLEEIPCRRVGRNRRVKFSDLMEYKQKQTRTSDEALQRLADEAQKLGLGY